MNVTKQMNVNRFTSAKQSCASMLVRMISLSQINVAKKLPKIHAILLSWFKTYGKLLFIRKIIYFQKLVLIPVIVMFLFSCHYRTSTTTLGIGSFLPINIKEQLSGYLKNIEAGYMVLPIYARNTASKELVLDSPFFISNLNAIEEKLNKTISKAKQFQVTFFFINREGEMIALPIPAYSFFKDYSIVSYRASISKQWKNEIFHLFRNKQMKIQSSSWISFHFYRYYEYGNLYYVEASIMDNYNSEFNDYLSGIVINEQDNGIWKRFFSPVPYQIISNNLLIKQNEELLIIEQLNAFTHKGQQLFRINNSDIIPITQSVGQLSLEIQNKIKSLNPKLILFILNADLQSSNMNAYDCLRHYANDNGIFFFFRNNSGDVVWCK